MSYVQPKGNIGCINCQHSTITRGREKTTIDCQSKDAYTVQRFRQAGKDIAKDCPEYCQSCMITSDAHLIDLEWALDFILAGKSKFILVSGISGVRLSISLKSVPAYNRTSSTQPEPKEPSQFRSTTKANNERAYFITTCRGFIGTLLFDTGTQHFKIVEPKNRDVLTDDIYKHSLLYVLNALLDERFDIPVQIFHTGYCGKCGRKLTTPQSIQTGLGPTCQSREQANQQRNQQGDQQGDRRYHALIT